MVILILENASEKLRGMLTRWMIEPKAGVFVGSLNAMVRDELWRIIPDYAPKAALMIYSCDNEQGYRMISIGDPSRTVIDLDGLQLIKFL